MGKMESCLAMGKNEGLLFHLRLVSKASGPALQSDVGKNASVI